jgi:arsenite methyltransferase
VINLSPRKARAVAECARVLRPGGRLWLSDLTVEGDLPPEVATHPAAWAG